MERKYGEFTLIFKIPEIYEKKWKKYSIQDGVLSLFYEKDIEE
jgi:HSP20 family molecular chaperone IbpA